MATGRVVEPADFGAALAPGALVVFGEVHGTMEVPAFVAEVAAAVRGPVTLALELPDDVQPALDAYLRGALLATDAPEAKAHSPGQRGVERCAADGYDGVYRVGMLTPSEPLR